MLVDYHKTVKRSNLKNIKYDLHIASLNVFYALKIVVNLIVLL